MAKRNRKNSVQSTALLYIVVGVLFIIFRATLLNWLLTIVGALFIASGIIELVRGNIMNGIVNIVIGAIVIYGGWQFLEIVLIIFGALLALKGLIDFFAALKRRNLFPILVSILTIVAGIFLILGKFVMLDWFFIAIGAILIADGLLDLFRSSK
ncbi:MAG: DUF308 domain-containing protein [Clostridia bacterium]|nr:DUF308 domain-containing protein [Clostridia bacterium]